MGELMNADKGGRRVNTIGLEQCVSSPMHTVCSSAGSSHFKEPLHRHAAEEHSTEDKRQERRDHGFVHFRPEPNVPDVGGLGWRTRAGHLFKNQAYYSALPKVNKWDLPIHAGVNSWKEWHGPRLRSDAPLMERLDHYDEEEDHAQAKKLWVNTVRAQTLDRFYNQKLNRHQKEASPNWAPHRRGKREIHSSFENFDDMDEKPEKELKKVLTAKVLQRDRDAIRHISKRVQNEETWKMAWKHMEQERRQDIRHDFRQRQHYNNLLMHLSGQPYRSQEESMSSSARFNNCSQRTDELALPREPAQFKDVTQLTDFRGLIHADSEHALEALMPGYGHELSAEFKQRATASSKASFPPPPAAVTPRRQSLPSRDASHEEVSLTTESIPGSKSRLSNVGFRRHDSALKKHSKAQFLTTAAPPPPDQKRQLLNEDFSPKTTMRDPGRVTGDFERTDHANLNHGPYGGESPNRKGMELLPPASRSYVYPVLVSTSPNAKGAQALSAQASEVSFPATPMSTSQPNFRRGSTMSSASPGSRKSLRNARGGPEGPTAAVCRELEAFEDHLENHINNVSNFFATPKSHRRGSLGRGASEPVLHSRSSLS